MTNPTARAAKTAREFSRNLLKLADEVDMDVATVTRKEVLKLYKNIIVRSPVKSGVYRASHGIANIEPQGTENVAVALEGKTVDDMWVGPVLSAPTTPPWTWKIGDGTIWLYNNVPYAERIEDGWSTKNAPQGVYREALLEFNTLFGQRKLID